MMQIFSVYDSAANAFMSPFFIPAKGLAIRSFQEAVNKPGTPLNTHPADFTLFELGTFDEGKCIFNILMAPERVISANELVTKE